MRLPLTVGGVCVEGGSRYPFRIASHHASAREALVRTPLISVSDPTSRESLSPSVLRLHLRRGAAREVHDGRHRSACKECRTRDPARPDIYSLLEPIPCEWSGEKQGCMRSHHAGRHPHLDSKCGRHHQLDALVRSALSGRQHALLTQDSPVG